ncbi:MAG: AMP-binding protein, partial [Polyangia bacterium]|nr:AMP-binding protein [Polyangia bacterium]
MTGTGVTSRDIVALLDTRARRFGNWPAIRYRPAAEAPLVELSWAEWRAQAQAMANWLHAVGVVPGHRVAIFSRNRPEWLVTDVAILMA